MYIKKILFLIIFFLFQLIKLNAQKRENREILHFESKSSKITYAIGWAKNDEIGKWISNKNIIDTYKLPSYSYASYHKQNFKFIQLAKINLDSQFVYVLLVERLDGSYEYPNLKINWIGHKLTEFFVLKPEQRDLLREELRLKRGKTIKIESEMFGEISTQYSSLGGEHLYNEPNLLAKISKVIIEGLGYNKCFVFNAQVVEGDEILRFRIPERCYDIETKFEKGYFEMPTEKFSSILDAESIKKKKRKSKKTK